MILKHRDRELLRFEWTEPQGVRIVSVNEDERKFLPLEMKDTRAIIEICKGLSLNDVHWVVPDSFRGR